jgi:general secretion pathway protein C
MLEFSSKKFTILRYFLFVLILVSSLYLIRAIIEFSFSKGGDTISASDNASTSGVKKINLMNYSPILENNPFGNPMELQAIGPKIQEKKEIVRASDIVLLGTVTGPTNLSYAIFEDRSDPKRVQEVFAFGEEVFGYGRLTKITRTSADIEGPSGKLTLSLNFDGIPSSEPVRERSGGKHGSPKTFIKKLSEKEYLLDRESVLRSLENPEQILTEARLLPNIKEGRQEGFIILEVTPGGIYDSLGLRNKDILLRINGLEMSNPEVAIQAMTALRGMNRINLDIIRADKKMSFSYRMR